MAQSPKRPASGALADNAKAVPMVACSSGLTSDQSLTYSFSAPELIRGNDGLTSVVMSGLDNFGPVGSPALPYLPVRIAIPQGRTVKSVTVTVGDLIPLGTGINVRHVEKQFSSARAAKATPTLRNDAIYSSDDPYPAKPESKGDVAWKRGVGFYEMTLCPVVYQPLSGKLGYYGTISVSVTLNAAASSATRGGAKPRTTEDASSHTPFLSRESAASVLSLLDNPAVVSGYKAQNPSRGAATLDGEVSGFVPPELPCVDGVPYKHVIITSEELSSTFLGLVQYRRQNGMSSTLVTIEEVLAAYDSGEDLPAVIRKFIKDAYEKWGTEYVLLGGDTSIIPARALFCVAGEDEDELPSDLYYQCLDGDFDANGNGIYGEEDDDVDLYSEVSVGRVSAETPTEARNWLVKMRKYDADCRKLADYTRSALFVGEYVGPYENTYAKPLLEIIRKGTAYKGSNGGLVTYGFEDAPEKFDADKLDTLYAQDDDWDANDIASRINENSFSVINHMGHSDTDYNMQMSNDDVDALNNENPVFVYSQGCIAGAFDRDCIAEHFTTSTESGAFAGVWNSRYGWYSFNGSGLASTVGASELYHRRFWDAVFRDGITEMGDANALSHERNAPVINSECMRWVYYESNLFGDPAQNICGPTSRLHFDREAYKSSATAVISYECATETNEIQVSLSAVRRVFDIDALSFTSSEDIAVVEPKVITLLPAGMIDNRYVYTAELPLSSIVLDAKPSSVQHDDQLVVSLIDGSLVSEAVDIDDVAPAFRDVKLRNSDVNLIDASWITYSPDKSRADGPYTDELTLSEFYFDAEAPFSDDPLCIDSIAYSTSGAARVADLDNGLYYVRILAVDKAGNTNVWNSTEVSTEVAPEDTDEYGTVIVAARNTRAFYNMENGTSTWETNGCWQLGVPSFGPLNSSRCYGTVINGRYPDGANDALVSPPVYLGNTPSISFRQWYDIEVTPEGYSNLDKADYGIVELLVTGSEASGSDAPFGVWHNVSQYARVDNGDLVQGRSDGWEDVSILLPEEYEGKTVRIRFRFVSDDFTSDMANPAGWYIDNISFMDVTQGGVSLAITGISDDGEDDGYAQPGETVTLELASCNVSDKPLTIPAGRGTISISAPGVPADSVKLVGDSPAPISYPVLLSGELTPADNTISIEIADSVPYGTVVIVSQVLIGINDKPYESYTTFTIADPCLIEGRVEQPTGEPVINATVSINASEGDYVVETDENGEFSIAGFSKGRLVQVEASYGQATAASTVTTPAEDLVIVLPLAEICVSETELEYSMMDTDPALTGSFVISNFFDIASLDGNVGPSADLEYSIVGFEDDDGAPLDWLRLITPAEGAIAPNESLTVEFELNAAGVDASIPRTVTLFLFSNAWNEGVVAVTITLNITGTITLEPYSVTATDLLNPPSEDNDNDGFLEGGETGTIILTAKNPSMSLTVESFIGTFTTDNANLSLVGPDETAPDTVTWSYIYAGSYRDCDAPLSVIQNNMADGEVAIIHVSGDATLMDGTICPQELDFVWTNTVRNIVGGNFKVEDFSFVPTVTNPVVGAKVLLFGENGDALSSGFTTAEGLYKVSGLIPDAKYWVTFSTMSRDNATVPPMGFLITADENGDSGEPKGGVFDAEILGASYGTNGVPHLRLASVEIVDADGDGGVDYGEEINLLVNIKNDGFASANNLVAEIYTPEFEYSQCMDVVTATDSIKLIAPQGDGAFTNLKARVYDAASISDSTGGFQRFVLDIHEEGSADPERHWYFDFKVEIAPRLSISGTVNAPDGVSLEGLVVSLVNASGTTIENDTFDAETIGSGDYAFGAIDPGEYTVAISGIPAGYACNGAAEQSVTLVDADVTDVDFELIAWELEAKFDDEYLDDETGGIHIEIDEGESVEVPVTFENKGSDDEELEIKVTYNRTAGEVLTMDRIAEAKAAIRASLTAKLGNDWTKLDSKVFSKDEIEVTFKKGTPVAARDAYLARHGFRATYHFTTIPASIAVPDTTGNAIAAASAAYANAASFKSTAADDIVEFVQPSVIGHGLMAIELPPQDTLYPEQWALNNLRQAGGTLGCDIGAESAWSYSQSTGSKSIHVAVTDTGVLYTHPDLRDNWSGYGWNYVYNNGACEDEQGHGTHVAGIIGAVGNNGIGISGVNWNVGLVSSRICVPDGFGGEIWATSAQIARAFEEAYTLFGCCVNNNSWGGPIESHILLTAMEEARNHDMLFVIAAGNTADDLDLVPDYPASWARLLDNVIVVAAADGDDNIAEFSCYSPKIVHLAAPGYDILSTYINTARGNAAAGIGASASGEGNYAYLSGTSMAAPYVTGAAALLKSIVPAAPYTVIRDALLNGVRKDDNLAEFVATSGHLDIGNSVRLLGNMWLRFPAVDDEICIMTNVTLKAGETFELPLIVNDKPVLTAGDYSAVINVKGTTAVRDIPVTLTVNPAAVATADFVKVTAEEQPDGYLAYGEEVSFDMAIKNIGSQGFEKLTAELVAVNGTVVSGTAAYDNYLPGDQVTDPALGFTVKMPESGDTAEFTLNVYEDGELVAELPVSFDLFDGNVVAVTVTDGSAKGHGAIVEVIGASAAKGVTDADGVAILAIPNVDGSAFDPAPADYILRVTTDGAVRYVDAAFDPTVATKSVALAHAAITVPETIELSITEGTSATTNLVIGASAALSGTLDIAEGAKVAVFDDQDNSEYLVESLKKIGFAVDYYTNNYQIVRYNDPKTLSSEIIYMVRYTWDAALIYNYDAVISIVSGANGDGRLLNESEHDAFEGYVQRGGKLIIAGNTTLARPDNVEFAALAGLDDDACEIVEVEAPYAQAIADLGAPFIELEEGALFPTGNGDYDSICIEPEGGEFLASADSAAKIYATEPNDLGGQYIVWNGLGDDWNHAGAALDILVGSLYSSLAQERMPAWISPSASDFNVSAGGKGTVALTVNGDRDLGAGDYTAVVYLLAETDGASCTPVTVKLTVVPPVLDVNNFSGSVTDWGNRPLKGNGSATSASFQVIYAGANGVIDPPNADGMPGGDDLLLVESASGMAIAYFGCGDSTAPDAGKFSASFNLAFDGYSPDMGEIKVYVRAWDSSSPAASVAYGDSELRTIEFFENMPAPVDFGSWVVGTGCGADILDTNGDTIPDNWAFEFRPDLDPRAPIEPLGVTTVMARGNQIATAVAPASYNADGKPARVFVTEKFVVVLEQYTHRIAVYNREYAYNGVFRNDVNGLVHYYGATAKNGAPAKYTDSKTAGQPSDADGAFNKPFGMALDLYTTKSIRFAVADTGNNRVQLFSLDPETGDITFLSTFGTKTADSDIGNSADTSTFSEPHAVAFMKGGDLLVADTGNFRVLRVKTTGDVFGNVISTFGFPAQETLLTGICADTDNVDGFWVADADITKQRISFHHTGKFSPEPVVSIGTPDSQDVVTPSDVQIWTINGRKRICAIDRQGSRLRIIDAQANAKGAYTNLVALADIAYAADPDLEEFQKLWCPTGVFPVNDENLVYVADYGHSAIKWFSLEMDADGDGMDDFWEDRNGLDSAINDAMDDADGDGLVNIGEFRSGCDPQNSDTDDDGAGDLAEMFNLTDPLSFDAEIPEFLNIVSIEVFDEDGNPTNEVEVGNAVMITVTLDAAPEADGLFVLTNEDGDTVGGGTPEIDGNEMTFVWVATDDAIGMVDVKFTLPECDPPVVSELELFEVVAAEEPDPDPEFEEVEWHIKSIEFVDGTPPALRLKWNSPEVAAGTECNFRICCKKSLSDAEWNTNSIPVITITAPAEGVGDVDLTQPYIDPAQSFFKLIWLNKEKGE